eukprot:scaffold4602_cov86-Isochrysis_galbana.AAC.1
MIGCVVQKVERAEDLVARDSEAAQDGLARTVEAAGPFVRLCVALELVVQGQVAAPPHHAVPNWAQRAGLSARVGRAGLEGEFGERGVCATQRVEVQEERGGAVNGVLPYEEPAKDKGDEKSNQVQDETEKRGGDVGTDLGEAFVGEQGGGHGGDRGGEGGPAEGEGESQLKDARGGYVGKGIVQAGLGLAADGDELGVGGGHHYALEDEGHHQREAEEVEAVQDLHGGWGVWRGGWAE